MTSTRATGTTHRTWGMLAGVPQEEVTMTTQSPDGAQPEPDLPQTDEPDAGTEEVFTPPPRIPEGVNPKQIHRWKAEGGALHPDD